MKFDVWYFKPGAARAALCGELKSVSAETHTFLGLFEAFDLNQLYEKMQAEVWSPSGEARSLIEDRGLSHTSMSVGDGARAVDGPDAGRFFLVEAFGFKDVTEESSETGGRS